MLLIDINIFYLYIQGIRKSCSLQHLSLKQCKIGDYGAQLLSQAVQGKPSIGKLAVVK
jgi:hypothetical protein